ncbi:hypothetical protein [Gracilimonas sp.]|uniref:hypothetical protein n=1 Tax=Gracilimonas sp. TaxID=1974203 RepID=UPI002872990C|nr:hypothetical protein [Gracilimonas sp.]
MKNLLVGTVILLIVGTACNSENGVKETLPKLVKVDSLILQPDSQHLFGMFYEDFKINEQGNNLAFYDRIKEKVFVFDRKGRFVQVYGENNKGPNGILNVAGYDFISNGNIAILDMQQRLLKIFDQNGEVIKSSPVFEDEKFFYSGLEFLIYKDEIYLPIIDSKYYNNPNPDSSSLIGKLDLNGNFTKTFGKYDPFLSTDNQYMLDSNFDITNAGIIYTNLSSSYGIRYYDLNDYSYLGSFGVQFPSFSLPKKEVKLNLPISEITKRMTGASTTYSIHSTENYFVQHVQVLTEEWFENVNNENKENLLVL